VPGDELVELDGFPHHRIMKKRDVDRLIEPLQHGRGLFGQRIAPFLRHVEAHREEHRQIRQRRQHAKDAEGIEGDLPAPLPDHGAEVGAQRISPPCR
jgi:hypothetical protein